jgi:hypothetical protein
MVTLGGGVKRFVEIPWLERLESGIRNPIPPATKCLPDC